MIMEFILYITFAVCADGGDMYCTVYVTSAKRDTLRSRDTFYCATVNCPPLLLSKLETNPYRIAAY